VYKRQIQQGVIPNTISCSLEQCDVISLDLKLIGSIILSTYVSIELLAPITPTLSYTIYPSQLVEGIRDMLRKLELTESSIWNMHLHNLKTDQ